MTTYYIHTSALAKRLMLQKNISDKTYINLSALFDDIYFRHSVHMTSFDGYK